MDYNVSSDDTTWYTLETTCAVCQTKGKTTVVRVGALLIHILIQEKIFDEFLAKHNDAAVSYSMIDLSN